MAAVAPLSCSLRAAGASGSPPRSRAAAWVRHEPSHAELPSISNASRNAWRTRAGGLSSGLLGTRFPPRRMAQAPRLGRRNAALVRAAGRDKDESSKDKDDVPEFKGFPPMQEKPAWYWRILACVPYILPFCEGWLYAKPAMYLFSGLKLYEALTMPVWRIIGKLPGWFLIAYILTAYTFVVRNNRWPHFIRFHVVNGMLLEIFLQAIGILNNWLPRSIYWGTIGTHFWLFMSVSYFFTVLLCILYALRGMYADVPFTSDASYMQIPYE